MRVEFTFSASDNEDAPESLISLSVKCNKKESSTWRENQINPKSNWVRVEFSFSGSDNEDAPLRPILFTIKCDTVER